MVNQRQIHGLIRGFYWTLWQIASKYSLEVLRDLADFAQDEMGGYYSIKVLQEPLLVIWD